MNRVTMENVCLTPGWVFQLDRFSFAIRTQQSNAVRIRSFCKAAGGLDRLRNRDLSIPSFWPRRVDFTGDVIDAGVAPV